MTALTSERLAEIREWAYHRRDHAIIEPEIIDLLAHVDHLTEKYARLLAGIEELASVGYSHTPDCEADEYQRLAYGGHPDCGLCWEDKLATLLNPPTEGDDDDRR